MTTDDGNPAASDFPQYMVEDKYRDRRRSQISRKLLREAHDVTFEDWQRLAFDTTLYWPMAELPRYQSVIRESRNRRIPKLAAEVKPYLDHLCNWDCRVTRDSHAGNTVRRMVRRTLRRSVSGGRSETAIRLKTFQTVCRRWSARQRS